MKTSELAKRLRISSSTVRAWASDYAAFLAPKAAGKQSGSPRSFSEADALVMATVANMREKGFAHEQIIDALELDDPAAPTETPAAAQAASSSGAHHDDHIPLLDPDEAIVPVAQLHRTLDEFRHLQKDMEKVEAERDRILERWEQDSSRLTERVIGLEGKVGEYRGELRVIRKERKSSDWWLRVVIAAILVTIIVMALTTTLILNPPF